MLLHRNAKLGLAGRLALVRAVEGGLSLKRAAARFSVSPATAHRWWHRWQAAVSEERETLRAAGGVERDTARQPVEDLPHDRLLQVDELVSRLVIEPGPAAVPLSRRDRVPHGPVAQLLDGIQQRTDLGEASHGEVAVILPGEGAKQGDPLQTEQIRQRVLVDHRRLDAGL